MSTRRKFIAGLAAAPVAAVPAFAAASNRIDPALAALAEWRAAKAIADADAERLERASDAYHAEIDTLDPLQRKIVSLEEFDRMFRAISETPELTALRSRLKKNIEARCAASLRHRIAEAEEKVGASGKAEINAMRAALETEATTTEGALGLLELAALSVEYNEELYFEGDLATAPARAIRAALRVLRAQSPPLV